MASESEITPFQGPVSDLGHGGRVILLNREGQEVPPEDGKKVVPIPVIYGCMYWGNQNNVGITDVFELPFSFQRHMWFNEQHGVGVDLAGKHYREVIPADPHYQSGSYVSPNRPDVTLFITGFIRAASLALPPNTQEG